MGGTFKGSMKQKLYLLIIIPVLLYGIVQKLYTSDGGIYPSSQTTNIALENAYHNHKSNVQIQGSGIVIKLLWDDNDGSRHQKFILKANANQTLLVAHNIDLAPRINGLRVGEKVEFYGEYEWNQKGGIIHWTHHDPNHRHTNGWLKHNGKTYQ